MSQKPNRHTLKHSDSLLPAVVRRLLLAVVCACCMLVAAPQAHAWSGSEHIRHVDQAYQVMNILRRGAADIYAVEASTATLSVPPLTKCPASVCTPSICPTDCPLDPTAPSTCTPCGNWHRFISQVMAAPAKLDRLKVDLTDPNPGLFAPNCAGLFPQLAAGKTLAQCNAGDLPFAPRRGWRKNDNECYLRPGYIVGGADQNPSELTVQPFFHELSSNFTGAVMGQWATRPDDELEDTRVWIRPTHSLIFGELTGIAEGLVDAGLAIAIAPIVCIADFIFGGGDCVKDAIEGGKTLDLLNLADTGVGLVELYTFGQKTFTSDDFPVKQFGVALPAYFHFANVNDDAFNQLIPGNQFNILPGFKEIDGGAGIGPILDALDVGVIAGTDLLGVTVHPYKSNGVTNYSPFADGEQRNVGDWINATLGHVEFEPVQNLAAYGWSQFRNGDSAHPKGGARGIGWVMHAIGDASQPHHTIGALGWGHAWWETFANLSWEPNFREEDVVRHYSDLAAILAYGFTSWTFLDTIQQSTGSSDLDVRAFIQRLARQTNALDVASVGSAFIPAISVDTSPSTDSIHFVYDSESAHMKDLMERSAGASLGFLAKASDLVPTTESPCSCGSGASHYGQDAAGTFIRTSNDQCQQCGVGPFQNLPNWVDGECVAVCPPDKPTPNSSGICTSAGACPPGKPFVQNGACVTQCPANTIVLNDRNCVPGNTCPAGTERRNPNICVPKPKIPGKAAHCNSQDGDFKTCTDDSQCCSENCNKTDGVCRSRSAEPCFKNGDCISNICKDAGTNHGVCQPGPSGAQCSRNADCTNGKCNLPDGHCNGLPGDGCNLDADCMTGSFCTEGHSCCIPDGLSCDTGGSFCCGSCDQSTSTPGTCFTGGIIP